GAVGQLHDGTFGELTQVTGVAVFELDPVTDVEPVSGVEAFLEHGVERAGPGRSVLTCGDDLHLFGGDLPGTRAGVGQQLHRPVPGRRVPHLGPRPRWVR